MYLEHFGLQEAPFSLAPDPRYLYLSGQHREALAHLLYGVRSEGGFVQLTGEVGTGKTTVCRCFLEQLPRGTRAAVILNPSLTAEELLAAVCDEFEIPRPEGPPSLKGSLDLINRFLLDAHAAGERAVLVVDEAQNLDPAVLEQVRLLTNLETSRNKLLQIILMGQPELRATLARPDLRQLAQRVTARFHLNPLSREETAAYVRHRLGVAGCYEELFPPAVIGRLRRLSRGIPRLINILCDRALLGAYVQGKRRVDRATLDQAAREVAGETGWRAFRWRPLAAVLGGCLVVAAVWAAATVRRPARTESLLPSAAAPRVPPPTGAGAPQGQAPDPQGFPAASTEARTPVAPAPQAPAEEQPPPSAPKPVGEEVPPQPKAPQISQEAKQTEPAKAPSAPVMPGRASTPQAAPRSPAAPAAAAPSVAEVSRPAVFDSLQALLAQPEAQREEEAWRWLYRLWGISAREGENGCTQALLNGLDCFRGTGGIEQLRALNRPAIVRIYDSQGAPRWLVLERLREKLAIFSAGGMQTVAETSALAKYGIREFVLLWRPPALSRTLAPGDRGDGVAWLERRLAADDRSEGIAWLEQRLAGALEAAPGGESAAVYDEALSERVRDFQRSHGLKVDGIAGPAVLLALDIDPEPGTPTLAAMVR